MQREAEPAAAAAARGEPRRLLLLPPSSSILTAWARVACIHSLTHRPGLTPGFVTAPPPSPNRHLMPELRGPLTTDLLSCSPHAWRTPRPSIPQTPRRPPRSLGPFFFSCHPALVHQVDKLCQCPSEPLPALTSFLLFFSYRIIIDKVWVCQCSADILCLSPQSGHPSLYTPEPLSSCLQVDKVHQCSSICCTYGQ